MKVRFGHLVQLLAVIGAVSLLLSCTASFPDTTLSDVPISVRAPDSQDVDADVALASVESAVRQKLPRSYFRLIVFHGKGRDLPRLEGTLVFGFLQVQSGLFKDQVLAASAAVETGQQTMNLKFVDESEHYVVRGQQAFPGDKTIKQTAGVAYDRLAEMGVADCQISLEQLDEVWVVSPRALRLEDQPCRFQPFGIRDGQITYDISVK